MTTKIENIDILGVSDKEQVVFHTLISRGESSVTEMADALAMKRPTLYLHLDTLKQKGLVLENLNRKKKTFQAVSMTVLNKIIDQKIQSLQKLKTQIPKFIKENKKQAAHKTSKGFTIYRGESGLKILADEVARFDGPVYYLGSLKETERFLDNGWYEKFYNRFRRKKMNEDYMISTWNSAMTVRLFYEESDLFTKRRFLPKEIQPKGCFAFYGDKLVIAYYYPEITLVVLEDKAMVEMFKTAYSSLWDTLEGENIPPVKIRES